jgi:hypothetical protein
MADIAVWEDTPIEWRYNQKHYAYGGRRWVAKCPHCPRRWWTGTWETAETLRHNPHARAEAATRLRTAITEHVEEEHR